MNKLKIFNALSCVLIISGCASSSNVLRDHITKLDQPFRIIEHDFANKYTDVIELSDTAIVPNITGPDESKDKTNAITDQDSSEDRKLQFVDIPFLNESAEMLDAKAALKMVSQNIDSDHFLIIGHSHGKSSFGVESLASKRARNMSVALMKIGIPKENIYFVSAWSDGGQNYQLSKGVRVIGLPTALSDSATLITGISHKRT